MKIVFEHTGKKDEGADGDILHRSAGELLGYKKIEIEEFVMHEGMLIAKGTCIGSLGDPYFNSFTHMLDIAKDVENGYLKCVEVQS